MMQGMQLPADVQSFLSAYADAFNRLDGAAVAQMFAVPSAISDASGTTLWPNIEPIRENMRALCRLYREDGFVRASFEPLAFIAQGAMFAVVDGAWSIELDAGRAPRRFRTGYQLRRDKDAWRIVLCIAYSEPRLGQNSDH
jgi:ketosteroid isomerase-like protein